MSKVEEFEKLLKAAVGGKRLSQSKMTALTDLALANFEYDTQLVSILYRTHKSLPAESKVPSLYIFDSLARAARSRANQTHVDPKSSTGNAATFLAKIEGILDGLIQDMVATGSTEAKEKTLKVLDIWTKANTFPPPVLARLTGYTRPGIDNANSQPSSSTTPATGALAQGTVDPRKGPTPPSQPGVSTLYQAPVPDTSGLLALLAQAQATATTATATPSNPNTPAPDAQIDPAQLALLQRLAGNLAQPGTSNNSQPGNGTGHNNDYSNRRSPHTNRSPDQSHYRSSDYPRRNYDDRSPPPRDRDRYNDRDRRRSYSDRSRFDDRDGYRGGGRGYDRDGPARRGRWDVGPDRRRSRSPGYRGPPSSRPPIPERERDGRDSPLNSANPSRHGSSGSFGPPRGHGSSSPPSSAQRPSSAIPSFEPADQPAPQSPAQSTVGQSGLQAYDFTAFDPMNAACWDSLGKAWAVSYGKPPTQDELMMFVMSGGMSVPGTGAVPAVSAGDAETSQIPTFDGGNDDANPNWNGHQSSRGRGRGRGRGGYGGGRNGYGVGDDTYGGPPSFAASSEPGGGDTSGSGPSDSIMAPSEPSSATPSTSSLSGTVATKGQMVKIGDKWKWVKKGDIIP